MTDPQLDPLRKSLIADDTIITNLMKENARLTEENIKLQKAVKALQKISDNCDCQCLHGEESWCNHQEIASEALADLMEYEP